MCEVRPVPRRGSGRLDYMDHGVGWPRRDFRAPGAALANARFTIAISCAEGA